MKYKASVNFRLGRCIDRGHGERVFGDMVDTLVSNKFVVIEREHT